MSINWSLDVPIKTGLMLLSANILFHACYDNNKLWKNCNSFVCDCAST